MSASRLSRFEDYRFVGDRDTMRVYDCDDDAQLTLLRQLAQSRHLSKRNLLQTFSPDTLAEAANRGFKPAARS